MSQQLVQRIFKRCEMQENGCLEWTGGKVKDGYGQIRVSRDSTRMTHAIVCEHYNGPANGLMVRHKCHNPVCCTPSHLHYGTSQENYDDMRDAGRAKLPPKGEAHHKAKLNLSMVAKIRVDPRRHHEIAKEYGVTRSSITAIKNGRAWRTS